jgi:membrane-bound metal-dependent hydrolase YbcI (DUF457 family)
MFVGHYGPSFAAKAAKNSIPLWILFLAVQLLDVIWSILVLLGIEKVRIVPGFTATNPLDLYYMPYTHSLVGALLWSMAASIAYYVFRKADGWPTAALVGAAVFSHWVLDWLVHRPDLPLYDNSFRMGLGLWNYPVFAFVLEIVLLSGGMYLYMRTTKPLAPVGGFGFVIFAFVMFAIEAYIFFGPPPISDKAVAVTALVCYAAFAGIAGWLERKRAPRTA